MTNLKTKLVNKAKRSNNERWFECKGCHDFKFAIYNTLRKNSPFCPRCGESVNTIAIEPPVLSARENYKPWKREELPFIHQVIKGEMLPYQCALKLDRSIASIESKCRREIKNVEKDV
jgi:hypothetical protein